MRGETGMSEHLIQYEGVSIDSTKLRVPLESLPVIDLDRFSGKSIIDNGTGEIIDEEWQKNKVDFIENGITTKVAIQRQVTSTGNTREFIVFQLNSKALMSAYQRGICMETLPLLCSHINSIGAVKVSEADLLGGELTDTDIKKDSRFLDSYMKQGIDSLHKRAKPSTKKGIGCEVYWRKDNRGIQFNDRHKAQNLRSPFVKIYSKHLDLTRNPKTREFTDIYLRDFETEGSWRFEVTLKNKKHMRDLGITDNTLGGFFLLEQSFLNSIMAEMLNANLLDKAPSILKDKALDINQLFWYSAIANWIEEGKTIAQIYQLSTRYIQAVGSVKQSQRARRQVKEYYQQLIQDEELLTMLKQSEKEAQIESEEVERILTEFFGV